MPQSSICDASVNYFKWPHLHPCHSALCVACQRLVDSFTSSFNVKVCKAPRGRRVQIWRSLLVSGFSCSSRLAGDQQG
eukprot:scaffold228865_cov14-Prasinocladus_malaysianus.AAC.1